MIGNNMVGVNMIGDDSVLSDVNEEMIVKTICDDVREILNQAKGSHDFEHTMRVYHLCEHIGSVEGADMFILRLAALLHDIARPLQDKSKGKLCHAKEGAIVAGKILVSLGVDVNVINEVKHCIETHRFRNDDVPETIEAKILYDADKLDSIGSIGIARTYVFAGEVGAKVHNDKGVNVLETESYGPEDTGYREYMVKLRHIAGKLITGEGKRIGQGRNEFMKSFYERLLKEVDGEL